MTGPPCTNEEGAGKAAPYEYDPRLWVPGCHDSDSLSPIVAAVPAPPLQCGRGHGHGPKTGGGDTFLGG